MAIGDYLRSWRQRRRMSQLDLACEANISTRHVSFLETGRARPSRHMVLHLAERLEGPPRGRNVLLVAAGFAPLFAERTLDDPALVAAHEAVTLTPTGWRTAPSTSPSGAAICWRGCAAKSRRPPIRGSPRFTRN